MNRDAHEPAPDPPYKVLGHQTDGSGITYGVEGRVDSPEGFGLATPDDARIEGTIDTNGTDFVVATDTSATGDAHNVVLGHASNTATSGTAGAVVGGGGSGGFLAHNLVEADFATVAGGETNNASGLHAVVGGGRGNSANSPNSTIAGGYGNFATDASATVAGGLNNTAAGGSSTVGGGEDGTADATGGTVGGGESNEVTADHGTVAGGKGNAATSGSGATVSGGTSNAVTATAATVPGGHSNAAEGAYSFAAGRNARALDDGSFVWADGTTDTMTSSVPGSNASSPTGPNTFHVAAEGGIRMVTGVDDSGTPIVGSYIPGGSSAWQLVSARSAKQSIEPVDAREVLDEVEDLEVSTWEYETDEGVRRMGPMAGEFHETFGLGDDPETIGTIDADGVALAAIQGLSAKVDEQAEELDEKDDRIDNLAEETATLRAENERLRERNEALEARLDAVEDRLGVDADADEHDGGERR